MAASGTPTGHRLRSSTQPSIRAADLDLNPVLPPSSPRSRASSACSTPHHGEVLRRAMQIKQEREELKNQMTKIQERLRQHSDVLFSDEREALEVKQAKLRQADEAKQQQLMQLQAQFKHLSNEEQSVGQGLMSEALSAVGMDAAAGDSSSEPVGLDEQLATLDEPSPVNHSVSGDWIATSEGSDQPIVLSISSSPASDDTPEESTEMDAAASQAQTAPLLPANGEDTSAATNLEVSRQRSGSSPGASLRNTVQTPQLAHGSLTAAR